MVPPRAAGRVAGPGPAGGPDRGRDAVVASRIPPERRDLPARTSRGERAPPGCRQSLAPAGQRRRANGSPPRARTVRCGDEGAAELRDRSRTMRPCCENRTSRCCGGSCCGRRSGSTRSSRPRWRRMLRRGAIPALRCLQPDRVHFVGARPARRGPGNAPAGPGPGRADGRCRAG